MARISLDPPRGPMLRIAEWYSRRKYGQTMDPLRAAGHNPKVLGAVALYESRVAKWRDLDPVLKHLAEMVTASRIGRWRRSGTCRPGVSTAGSSANWSCSSWSSPKR